MKKLLVIILCSLILSSCALRPVGPSTVGSATADPTTNTTVTADPTTDATVTADPTIDATVTADPTSDATVTADPTTDATVTADPTTDTTVTADPTIDTTATATEEKNLTSKGYEIKVVDGITYVGGILIANKTYGLPETYAPGGLTGETYDAYCKMYEAALLDGITLRVISGYRSYYDQRWIYNDYLTQAPQEIVDTFSARPGHSEHQSGMAMDMNMLYDYFADTPEGIWISEHAHEYGFIVRYPKDKEHITGYKYEPWHIRYVGVDYAKAIYESGLCLEEFFGITSAYAN